MYRPLVVPLVAFVLVSVPQFLSAQNSCDKQFVVSEVSLPATTHLPASEQAAIRGRLIGRCFDNQQLGELASAVSDVLQNFGYLQAAVPEPSITASDTSRYPQPISLNVEVKEGPRYKVDQIQVVLIPDGFVRANYGPFTNSTWRLFRQEQDARECGSSA